jgi:hypothetical protein
VENAHLELRRVCAASIQLVTPRFGAVAAVVAIAVFWAVSPTAAHPGRWHWSGSKVENRILGTVIRVEGRRVRISRPVTCLGQGRRIVRHGVDRWKHFNCIQSILFPPGGGLAGPDVLFRVHVVGTRRFLITNAQFAD